MDKAMTDRIEQQVRQAFPQSAIARVQVLQYGDDPEVEPGQAAVRVFFNWPGLVAVAVAAASAVPARTAAVPSGGPSCRSAPRPAPGGAWPST